MTIRSLVSFGALAVFALGCASTRPGALQAFTFDVDGVRYGITPMGSGAERANDLILLIDGRLRLRARDLDQDGRLDTLLSGTMPLTEADSIYALGIAEARAAGAAVEHEPARTYTLVRQGRQLVVWSVAAGGSGWENRFVVYESARSGPVASDLDADGTLDDHIDLQNDYARTLAEGQRDGRIETVEGRVRVTPSQRSPGR